MAVELEGREPLRTFDTRSKTHSIRRGFGGRGSDHAVMRFTSKNTPKSVPPV
jgi:hypothetical protein